MSLEEQSKLKSELGFTKEKRILLCVGELLPNKNQKMAIRAMKTIVQKFPETVLLLAGNGPEKENLEKEIVQCGMQEHIKMLGYCNYLEKYQRIADVSLACSYREGLPLNLVEAMLTQNSVVASVNRGHKELIQNGKNGYLVLNEQDMADRVCDLLKDRMLSVRIGVAARAYAVSYGFANVKKELNEIYMNDRER